MFIYQVFIVFHVFTTMLLYILRRHFLFPSVGIYNMFIGANYLMDTHLAMSFNHLLKYFIASLLGTMPFTKYGLSIVSKQTETIS